jgi:protein-S-isoprenylcysteine O-methyltransferase Ste14
MTTTTFLAYLLMICYLIIERLLRTGQAISLKTGEEDRGSSQIIWMTGLFSIFLILLAPILNNYQVGYLDNPYIAWIGIFSMLSGLTLRYWAAKILGKFYTRTLQIIEGQHLVDQAPYSIIRHPGYLGTFLIDIGLAIAINNAIIILIVALMGVFWRVYRIQVEEQMLFSSFPVQYQVYLTKTWKLIPFIY